MFPFTRVATLKSNHVKGADLVPAQSAPSGSSIASGKPECGEDHAIEWRESIAVEVPVPFTERLSINALVKLTFDMPK